MIISPLVSFPALLFSLSPPSRPGITTYRAAESTCVPSRRSRADAPFLHLPDSPRSSNRLPFLQILPFSFPISHFPFLSVLLNPSSLNQSLLLYLSPLGLTRRVLSRYTSRNLVLLCAVLSTESSHEAEKIVVDADAYTSSLSGVVSIARLRPLLLKVSPIDYV